MRDLIIERLLIRAYSGIGKHADPVELTNLVPGLNLLWGANRRGKSCTARAITASPSSILSTTPAAKAASAPMG